MKRISLSILLALSAFASYGQGTVQFSNLGSNLDAPIFDASTGLPLDSGWLVLLRAGPDADSLAPIGGPAVTAEDGYFSGGVRTVDSVTPGAAAVFQLVVWDGSVATVAEAEDQGLPWGLSPLFEGPTGGEGEPPAPPAFLVNLPSFVVGGSDASLSPIIAGRVWLDVNQNGAQDENEPGVEGVTVHLLACADNASLGSTATDENGAYAFSENLAAESYLVVEAPVDFLFTPWDSGDNDHLDSDVDPVTGHSPCIEVNCEDLTALQCVQTHWDAGLVPAPTPEAGLGVAGPGFWKNHPNAWPVSEIEIGGVVYSAEEARALISNGRDKSRTLFRSLLSAKLNVAAGNDNSCVAGVIEDADLWMAEHGPVGSDVRGNTEAWALGSQLHEQLEEYNDGDGCAPELNEAFKPVALTPELEDEDEGNGKGKKFRLRVAGEPGRVYVLQESPDLDKWTDVAYLENSFGITEALAEQIESRPNSFFRVTLPVGPAQKVKPHHSRFGSFRELGNDESVTLLPVVYEGDLVVRGNSNEVVGTISDEDFYTVVAGDLDIRGSNNKVSNITVLGRVIVKGSGNVLENVDHEDASEDIDESDSDDDDGDDDDDDDDDNDDDDEDDDEEDDDDDNHEGE